MPHTVSGRAAFHALTAAALAIALAAPPALAVDCPEPHPVRVCTEFFHSDMVFSGKILSVKQWPQPPDPQNIEGWFYQVQVIKAYRGEPGATVELYQGNDDSGFPVAVGKSYLLFMSRNGENRLAADNCGNSAELDQSGDNLNALEKVLKDVKTSAMGNIGGRIAVTEIGSRALTKRIAFGVLVSATPAGGGNDFVAYNGFSRQDGGFSISVPPGTYTVTGQSDDYEVIPYPLSFSNPKKVVIEPGSCADLQFLAEPKIDPTLTGLPLPPPPPTLPAPK